MLETLKERSIKKMKKKLFSFILIFLSIFNYSKAEINSTYSILLEEDNNTLMVIFRDQTGSDGLVISYGGYKWFKEVYQTKTNQEETFIQPARLGQTGNMSSWMMPKYQIGDFNFEFNTRGEDQYISFVSSESTSEIEGYITRGKNFSLATHQPTKAWYAGTFQPIKNLRQLELLSSKNSRIFCKLLSETFMVEGYNRELATANVSEIIFNSGYECTNSFDLIRKPELKKEKVSDQTSISLEETEYPEYKNYWWVLIILILGAFFLYTKTVPKPKKRKVIKKSSPTGFKKDLINYWQGKVSYGFSYWVCLTIIGTIISLPAFIFTDEFFDNSNTLIVYLAVFYLVFNLISQVYLIVGTWRSAEIYKAQKRKLKQSLIWGYLGQISIVLSIIRKAAEFL